MSENSNPVLGKHGRGETEPYDLSNEANEHSHQSSEDEGDIGPMPLPENGGIGVRKKRRGSF